MIHLLNQARHEILSLRRRNEILEAQMGVIEVFAAALGLKHQNGAVAPDVVWELERKVKELSEPKESQ